MIAHDTLTYPPMTDDTGRDAWQQIGPEVAGAHGILRCGVRGIDGQQYVAERIRGRWEIIRAGYYGPGAVTRADTLKGAVQHLNAFHEGETCIHCGHVHSARGHFCEKCNKRRYA